MNLRLIVSLFLLSGLLVQADPINPPLGGGGTTFTNKYVVTVVTGAVYSCTTNGQQISVVIPAGTGGGGSGDFLRDGSLPMTGTLDMGGNSITNVGTNSIVFMDGTKISSVSNGVLRVGSGTNLNTVVTDGNIQTYAPTPPVYLADGITTKKTGNTFSVANWIPNNLTDLYTQFLVQQGATSRGLLDGPGYLFNDQNGILPALSTNQTFFMRWYRNLSVTNIGGITTNAFLYRFEDGDGSITALDSFENTISVLSTVAVSNSNYKFDSGSLYIRSLGPGDTRYFSIASGFVTTGTNDFTVDFWAYIFDASANYAHLLDTRESDSLGFWALAAPGGNILFTCDNGFGIQAGTIPLDQWTHIAVVRYLGTYTVYADGIAQGSVFSSDSIVATKIDVGTYYPRNGFYNTGMYVDNFRFTKDAALWTEAFTPPALTNYASILYSTNSMSLVCTNKVLDFLPTSTWMSILASGTGLTTNDLQGYVSPDYGTNWYQASLVPQASIDLSNTLFQGTATYTNNVSASNMVLKAVTTTNKVVKILGMWGPSN